MTAPWVWRECPFKMVCGVKEVPLKRVNHVSSGKANTNLSVIDMNVLLSTGSWPRCRVNWWPLRRVDPTRESCSSTLSCHLWPRQHLNRAGMKQTLLTIASDLPLVAFLCRVEGHILNATVSASTQTARAVTVNHRVLLSSPDSLSCQWSWTDSWRDA